MKIIDNDTTYNLGTLEGYIRTEGTIRAAVCEGMKDAIKQGWHPSMSTSINRRKSKIVFSRAEALEFLKMSHTEWTNSCLAVTLGLKFEDLFTKGTEILQNRNLLGCIISIQ